MQYKNYNTYTITHKDAATERINAENAAQAIANMKIADIGRSVGYDNTSYFIKKFQ